MASTITRKSLELPSSSSRQDIVSALLSEYGTFGDDDASIYSYNYSPASPASDLSPPPPPPKTPEKQRSYSNDKPLPYGGRLSMRFQLRVDGPASPESPLNSQTDSQPRRINYRSISRDSKPPSLTLAVSNGSTAKVPPTPTLTPGSSRSIPFSQSPRVEEKELPPPPPEKSKRRTQQLPFNDSKSPGRPERKDSQQSRDGKETTQQLVEPVKRKPLPPKFTSLLDMKNMPRGGKGGPLPMPRTRNQTSNSVQQDTNRDRPSTAVEAKTTKLLASPMGTVPVKPHSVAAITNRLPPTPVQDDDMASKVSAPPPPPKQTKKPFAGMGLPSNPRGAKHVKGKSSTGFDWVKDSKTVLSPKPALEQIPQSPSHASEQLSVPAPVTSSSPVPNTMTPGPTPPPRQAEQSQQLSDVVSPMNDNDDRRPFSFEGLPPAPPPKQQANQSAPTQAANVLPPQSTTVTSKPTSPAPPPNNRIPPSQNAMRSPSPPQPASRLPTAFANLPSQQQQPFSPPMSSDSLHSVQQQQPAQRALPSAFSNLPSQQRSDSPVSPPSGSPLPEFTAPTSISPIQSPDAAPITNTAADKPTYNNTAASMPTTTIPMTHPVLNPNTDSDPTPFTPLTHQPLHTRAAPITAAHLSCYTSHAHSIWSKNEFQPQACMTCTSSRPSTSSSNHTSSSTSSAPRERMWACTWCYLRICESCAAELYRIPGKNLRVLVERRKAGLIGAGVVGKGNNGGVMSMLIEQEEEDAGKIGGLVGPKRHDSGAGGGNTTAPAMTTNAGTSKAGWQADEERYGGAGYESDDFS